MSKKKRKKKTKKKWMLRIQLPDKRTEVNVCIVSTTRQGARRRCRTLYGTKSTIKSIREHRGIHERVFARWTHL